MFAELAELLPRDRLSQSESDRRLHGDDLTSHRAALPDLVVYPQSAAEVAVVLSWASQHHVAVVPFGVGTSLEGHISAVRGGLALDLRRMNRILDVMPTDLTAVVQAGVTRLQLERRLGEHGLFFPVDPGADATLGGMAATNAAGTMTLRHGKMRERVLALEAVLPTGKVIRTGTRALKSSAGYDLTSLLVGSEGTFGVITELTLRGEPIPESTHTLAVSLPSMRAAGDAVLAALVAGASELRRLELIDPWEVRALNRFGEAGLEEAPLLLIELAGAHPCVQRAADEVLDALFDCGAWEVARTQDHTEQRRLWRLRHDAFFAEKAMAPGRQSVSTDVCVPVSALADTLERTREHMQDLGLTGGIVAHAGDGNVHAGLLIDPTDPDESRRVNLFLEAIVGDALAVGGTCTGEHGIGLGKRDALAREHPELIGVMRSLKRVFDPDNVMNPGKVLPDSEAVAT